MRPGFDRTLGRMTMDTANWYGLNLWADGSEEITGIEHPR